MSEDMEPQIKNIWKSSGGGYPNNSLKVLQVVPYSEINLWVWGTTIFCNNPVMYYAIIIF